MKSQLSLLFAVAFVIGMFSITSSGQVRLEKVKTATKASSARVKSRSVNWTVFVVDSVAGNTHRITPKSNSKLRVIVTNYPPDKAFVKPLENAKQHGKTSAVLKNTTRSANRTVGFTRVSSKNFLPVAIRILVNPIVRTAILKRQKDK